MELNIQNLMQTAIAEMENGQYVEASKHFDMVVINDPANIDAPFFRAYCNCYEIKLGEMKNAAISFTNAFYRYVDAVKALNDPVQEQAKMDYAINLLTELVSMYQHNAKNQMLTTPSLGLDISSAASNMNTNCMNKVRSAGAHASESVLAANEELNKSNKNTGSALVFLVVAGVIVFILWMGWGIWW